MILIGWHEDRAPDAEPCARPTRLVELPAFAERQATDLTVGSSTRYLYAFLAS
jgi:hypothetical protein